MIDSSRAAQGSNAPRRRSLKPILVSESPPQRERLLPTTDFRSGVPSRLRCRRVRRAARRTLQTHPAAWAAHGRATGALLLIHLFQLGDDLVIVLHHLITALGREARRALLDHVAGLRTGCQLSAELRHQLV